MAVERRARVAEPLPQGVLRGAVQTRATALGLLPLLQQLAQLGARTLPLGAGRILDTDRFGALDDGGAVLQRLLLGGSALGGDSCATLGGDGLQGREAGSQPLQISDGGRLGQGLVDRLQSRVDLPDAQLGKTGGEQIDRGFEVQEAAYVEGHGFSDRSVGELTDLPLSALVLDVDPALTVDATPLGGVHGLLRVDLRFAGRGRRRGLGDGGLPGLWCIPGGGIGGPSLSGSGRFR